MGLCGHVVHIGERGIDKIFIGNTEVNIAPLEDLGIDRR
jgi:hypothetical protein